MPPAEAAAGSAAGVLWLFAAAALIVLVLAAQVALGYAREARLVRRTAPDGRRFGRALAAGAAALGSGLWAAMLLNQASEPDGHALGYRPLGLVLVWLAATALGGIALALPARNPSRLAVVGSGSLLGIGVPLLQVALMSAIEPEAEIGWGVAGTVLAALAATVGGIGALHLVFRAQGRHGRHRRLLRWAAAAIAGIAVTIAQNLTLGAAVPQPALAPATENASQVVALALAGVVVPALLLAGLLRLMLLRDARSHAPAAPPAPGAAGGKAGPSGR